MSLDVDTTELNSLSNKQGIELTELTKQVTTTLELLHEQMNKGMIPTLTYIRLRDELMSNLQTTFNKYIS